MLVINVYDFINNITTRVPGHFTDNLTDLKKSQHLATYTKQVIQVILSSPSGYPLFLTHILF